jgi:WW domain binding protein 11
MGRKELNPADVYRKQQRKKELKKCKETRNVVRSVQELLSDPNKIEEEIQKAQKESDASALDKGLKDRIKELKMMKSVALTKQKMDIASGKADRDSAASLREAEIKERDLQRDRRRGLIPHDSTDSSKRANGGDDTYQKKDQETSSSSREKISDNTSQTPIQQQPLQQQPPQQQLLQQQYHSMPQHAVQLPVPSAFGIAPMLNFPPPSMLPQPPSFRPPPPPPPPRAVNTIVPPPLFQPPPSFPDSLLLKPAPPVLVPLPLPAVGIAVGLSSALPPPAPPVFIRPSQDFGIGHLNDEDTAPAVSAAPAHAPVPYRTEPVPKTEAENIVSSFPFSFSAADFKLPTAEELMKRRHALTAEAEAVVEHDDNSSGVSYPLPQALRAQEQKTYEPQMPQMPSLPTEMSTEIKESENAFFPKKRNIYIPPAVVAPKVSSGLGVLADYGSDSDDDNDNEDGDTAQQVDVAPAVTAAPRFVPMAFPLQLSPYEARPLPDVQIAFTGGSEQTENRPLPLPLPLPRSTSSSSVSDDVAMFLDSIAQNDITSSTPSDRVTDYQPSTRDTVPAADRPPPKPLLKSIKADSALTAFRPNALRVKRPALQTGKMSVKMPRVDGDYGMQIQGLSSSIAPSGEGVDATEGRAPALSGGVEDAYLNFLDEIGELTGG